MATIIHPLFHPNHPEVSLTSSDFLLFMNIPWAVIRSRNNNNSSSTIFLTIRLVENHVATAKTAAVPDKRELVLNVISPMHRPPQRIPPRYLRRPILVAVAVAIMTIGDPPSLRIHGKSKSAAAPLPG